MATEVKTIKDAIILGLCTGPLNGIEDSVFRQVVCFVRREFETARAVMSAHKDDKDITVEQIFNQLLENLTRSEIK